MTNVLISNGNTLFKKFCYFIVFLFLLKPQCCFTLSWILYLRNNSGNQIWILDKWVISILTSRNTWKQVRKSKIRDRTNVFHRLPQLGEEKKLSEVNNSHISYSGFFKEWDAIQSFHFLTVLCLMKGHYFLFALLSLFPFAHSLCFVFLLCDLGLLQRD